jgi:hypothetical protein
MDSNLQVNFPPDPSPAASRIAVLAITANWTPESANRELGPLKGSISQKWQSQGPVWSQKGAVPRRFGVVK